MSDNKEGKPEKKHEADKAEKKQKTKEAEVAPMQSSLWSPRASSVLNEEGADVPPLWLIMFTDVMALMLTFFVLMYTMSVPEEDKWDELSKGVTAHVSQFKSAKFFAGAQDSISVDKLDLSRALSLDYLEAIVQDIINQNENLNNVVLIPQGDRLILSLPVELLFEAGEAEVKTGGKRALFSLGGPLSRIKNRIEVIGHADPRPIQNKESAFQSNWELSLARAVNVAAQLENVGYGRPMIIKGAASARYDELPETIEEEQRLSLSRRVDVVIMKDDGRRRGFVAPL